METHPNDFVTLQLERVDLEFIVRMFGETIAWIEGPDYVPTGLVTMLDDLAAGGPRRSARLAQVLGHLLVATATGKPPAVAAVPCEGCGAPAGPNGCPSSTRVCGEELRAAVEEARAIRETLEAFYPLADAARVVIEERRFAGPWNDELERGLVWLRGLNEARRKIAAARGGR